MQDQVWYSTHNALNDAQGPADRDFTLCFHETAATGVKLHLRVYPFYDIQMIKRLLIKQLRLPALTEIKDLRILYKGSELPNHRPISNFDAAAHRKLYFQCREPNPNTGIRPVGLRLSRNVETLLSDIRLAMQRNISPKLTMDGTGGTYLMMNSARVVVGVFKPTDEEAFAPQNPRGYQGRMYQKGFRPGVLSGEGATRELAAYFLDSLYEGKAGVPETTMVQACHLTFCSGPSGLSTYPDASQESVGSWKTGSFQVFVAPSDGVRTESCGNFDCRQFSVAEVHNVGLFDLRVMNLDRNDGNILVTHLKHRGANTTPDAHPTKYRLVPIDHGLILPDVLDVADIDLVWYDWPHAQIPFSMETARLALSYQPDKDAVRLKRKLLIRDECLRTLRVCTRLVQAGVRMHLNLHQISQIAVRTNDLDRPSQLETLVKQAMQQVYKTLDSGSLMSTNRLGYTTDLAESSLAAIRGRRVHEEEGEGEGSRMLTITERGLSHWSTGSSLEDSSDDERSEENEEGSEEDEEEEARWQLQQEEEGGADNKREGGGGKKAKKEEGRKSEDVTTGEDRCWACGRRVEEEESCRRALARGAARGTSSSSATEGCEGKKWRTGESSRICGANNDSGYESDCEVHQNDCGGSSRFKDEKKVVQIGSTVEPIASLPSSVLFDYRPQRRKKRCSVCNRRQGGGGYRRQHSVGSADEAPQKFLGAHPRQGAVNKRLTGASRGTAYRRQQELEANSTWALHDSRGGAVPIDWADPRFERLFFELFEVAAQKHIQHRHPNWRSYPYNGPKGSDRLTSSPNGIPFNMRHHPLPSSPNFADGAGGAVGSYSLPYAAARRGGSGRIG